MSFISPQPCSSGSGGSHQGEFILCDNNGPFIRKFIQDDSGTVTDVVDLTIDGAPYIAVGLVGLCPSCPPVDPIPVCMDINCETDSITVCPPPSGQFHVIVDSAPPISGITVTVELDCETDSVTVCPPASGQFHVLVDNTVPVSGTVIVNQGTSPWVVSGTVAVTQSGIWSVGRTWTLNSGTDSVTATQGTSPWIISGPVTQAGAPWTVRLQDGTTGQLAVVDAAGDLQVDVNNFPATVSVTQGTSPWVVSGSGTFVVGGNKTFTDAYVNPTDAIDTIALNGIYSDVDGKWYRSRTAEQNGINGNTIPAAGMYVYDPGGAAWNRIVQPAALSDFSGLPGAIVVGNWGFNGAAWDRIRTGEDDTDGQAVTTKGETLTISRNTVFNGTTWDRVRSGAALGSILINNPTAANLNATVFQGTAPWIVSGTVAAAQAGVWNVGRTWNLSYTTDSVSIDVLNASTSSAPALTATGAAAIVLPANPARRSFTLQNTGTVPIAITFGAVNPTSTVYHFALAPGSISDDGKGSFYTDDQWTGDVRAFSSSAGSLVIMEIT